MKKYLLLVVIIFPIWSVSAAGVSVRPEKLEFVLSSGQNGKGEILVDNKSNEPVLYQVYPDKKENNFIISPSEFQLQPGEAKLVEIETEFWMLGEQDVYLSIVSRSLNATNMSATAGVKLPVHIKVIGKFWGFVLVGIVVLLSFVLAFLFLKALNRRK